MKVNKLGIYIHIPFCQSKCAYCDFYSLPKTDETLMEEYQRALLAHIKSMAEVGRGFQVDSIYFGGGTPTLYGGKRIAVLLQAVKRGFRVERDAEITVEGNPESASLKTIQTLRKAGVNRISLGMQSANAKELLAVGRPHSPEETREAVARVKACQIPNLSLDLIYGLPGQSPESWSATLEEAIALEPQHLSCYGLKVEEGTPLAKRVAEGEKLPSDETQAQLYLYTVERLRQAGYAQYEISNFARSGLHSRHNLGYWMGKPYLGFGASASSDFGGCRYTMEGDIKHYCGCVLSGEKEIFSAHDLMSQKDRQEEYLMLRLRTSFGIDPAHYEKTCQLDFGPLDVLLRRFAQEGWAEFSQGIWRLRPEGYLRSNLLISTLLEAQESSGKPKPPSLRIIPDSGKNTEKSVEKSAPNKKDQTGKTEISLEEDATGQFHLW